MSADAVYRLPRPQMALIVVMAALQAATLVVFLLLVRDIVDLLQAGLSDASTVHRRVGYLAVVVLVHSVARAVEFSVSERMGYEVVRALRMTMYEHLHGMSPRQVQGRSRGGLLLRFTGDLSMLRTWISRGIARGLVSMIVLAAGVGLIAALNPRLALTIGAVLCVGAALSAAFGPRLSRLTRWVRRKRSLLTSNIDEQLHALAVVQVCGRSSGEAARFARQNDSMTRSLVATAVVRGRLIGIAAATGWLCTVAVLYVGTIDVMAGRTTAGVVVASIIASRHLTGPVRRLGLSYDYWKRAEVSRRKVRDFLRSSSRSLEHTGLEPLRVRSGQIELRDITVHGALSQISQTVKGGEVVAILGPTGAGKSTLLAAIAGLVEPDAGEVLIDGHPLSERTLRSRFQRIGVVAPDLPLLRGTVRRNLTYRRPDATDDEVQRVVLACRLDEVLAGLPQGLDTWLVEGGRNLSTGQRQRIALGRALMGNPAILLLDEPTTNLDPVSKDVVRQVIAHHQGTVLLATHDLNEATTADVVWRMEAGRVVEVTAGRDQRDLLWAARPRIHATTT